MCGHLDGIISSFICQTYALNKCVGRTIIAVIENFVAWPIYPPLRPRYSGGPGQFGHSYVTPFWKCDQLSSSFVCRRSGSRRWPRLKMVNGDRKKVGYACLLPRTKEVDDLWAEICKSEIFLFEQMVIVNLCSIVLSIQTGGRMDRRLLGQWHNSKLRGWVGDPKWHNRRRGR